MSVAVATREPITMMPLNKPITKEDKIKAAHDYEEMFLKFFFINIIPKDTEGGLFGAGHSSEMYQSLWIDAAAKQAAKRGVGIAQYIIKALDQNYAQSQQLSKSSPLLHSNVMSMTNQTPSKSPRRLKDSPDDEDSSQNPIKRKYQKPTQLQQGNLHDQHV